MAQRFSPPRPQQAQPQAQAPKGYQDYLDQLDQLLKKNTGTGLAIGSDVSSNIPMYLPGQVRNPSGLGDAAPSLAQQGNGMTAPEPRQRAAPMQEQQPQEQQPQEQQPMGLEEFLTQFDQAVQNPSRTQPVGGVSPGIDQSQAIASAPDGGTVYRDGTIHYEDGTQRTGDPNAYGIASEGQGRVRYSDGNIREMSPYGIASAGQTPDGRERVNYTDKTMRYGNYQYENGQPQQPTPGGLEGLVSGIFGQNRPVTQAYGNYNPQLEPGSGYNTGTDLRTRDLQGSARDIKLPVNAKVVKVLQDDGTQWGDISRHQGWGNSVLVQLGNGEMLRFSHLSSLGNLQEGQTVPAGTVFGTPGATGNVNGEHLDLMYYDSQGNVANPSQFSGFSNPQGLMTVKPGQEAPGTVIPQGQDSQPLSTPVLSAAQNVGSRLQGAGQSVASQVGQGVQQASQQGGNIIQAGLSTAALPFVQGQAQQEAKRQSDASLNALGFNPKGTVGAQELMMGDLPGAAKELSGTVEATGKSMNAPELFTGEALRGEQPLGQVLSSARQYLGLPATGLRSAIDQKTLFPKVTAAESLPTGQPKDQSPKRTLQGDISSGLEKAGQGITGLAQSGAASLQNIFKPVQDGAKRLIGDIPGTADAEGNPSFSSLQDTALSKAGFAKNDVRDNFFKLGGSEMYKDYLKPNAQDQFGGALNLDLFNNDFFKDLGRISSVFGGSKDLNPATEKFVEFEKQKNPPMSRMGYSDEYDRGSVDDFNRQVDSYNNSLDQYFGSIRSSVAGVPSSFAGTAPSSAKNIFSGTSSSNMMSSPVSVNKMAAPQMMAAKPMSTPTRMSVPGVSNPFSAPSSSGMSSPAPQQSSSPVRMSTPAPRASSPAPVRMSTPAPAPKVNPPRPMSTPVRMSTPAPKPQSKPSNNVFSSIKSAIKNIFRR